LVWAPRIAVRLGVRCVGVYFVFYAMGLMVTLPCVNVSFLPHFGHLPSNLWMISSGGVSSMPS